MELETEELLQKWLKMQIWKQRISFLIWVLFFLSFIISLWFSYNYVLPSLTKQIENTQSILEQMSTVSEKTKGQEDLLKGLLQGLPR